MDSRGKSLAPTAPVEASGSEREKLAKIVERLGPVMANNASPEQHADWLDLVRHVQALRPNDLANEIRRVDGNHDLGAGALAEALMPFLSARPLALEGQQGVQERCQRCGGEVQGWLCQSCPAEFRENDDGHLVFDEDSTPARAEAPDEGAAGERFAYVPLGRGAYPEDLIDYLNGFITGGSGRCREGLEGMGITIAAHPSPPPAADEDGVREAIRELIDADKELAEAINFAEPTANNNALTTAEYRARAARNQAKEALAALKSTAAKEGGE